MSRFMADCRRWPSDIDCSPVIIGEADEVVHAPAEHAASVHGHDDTPELRQQLRESLEPAEAYRPGARTGTASRTAPPSPGRLREAERGKRPLTGGRSPDSASRGTARSIG
jgi:Protein of unknown function (DUF1059)